MKPIVKSSALITMAVMLFATHPAMSDTPVPPYTLSDPLVMADGAKVTTPEQWRTRRRPELLHLFEENVYGKTLAGLPPNPRFVVREEKKDARGGKATRLRVGILFEGLERGRQMELLVYLPNHINHPVPVFLGLNFDGNFATTDEVDLPVPTHFVNGLFYQVPDHRPAANQRGHNRSMWPYDTILARGYGIATACYGEVEPDMPNQWWHGPRVLGVPTRPDDWGAIGAWAWALSRALDFLQTDPRIDPNRVAVFGFSRLGKTAMWAGAQDERFAAVISQNSGKGGVSLSKRLVGEPVAHLSGKDLGHWFAPNYAQYANNEATLPVDGHELAALIAPRPLLILSGIEDTWSDPEGEFLSGIAATPVYWLLKSEGLTADKWPQPPTLINSNLGYFIRPGGHNVTAEDWQATLDWADKYLAGPPQSPQEVAQNGVVEIPWTGLPIEENRAVLDLSVVLERHPQAKLFKVTGRYAMGGGSGGAEVIYDRSRHTLRTHSFDGESGVPVVTVTDYLYRNVTDTSIHTVADTMRGDPYSNALNSHNYCFDSLIKWGCTRTGNERQESYKALTTPRKSDHPADGVVVFAWEGMPMEPDAAILALTTAIGHNTETKVFKARGEYAVGGGYGGAELIYDRTRHTLRTHEFAGGTGTSGVSVTDYLYKGVTDELINAVASRVRTDHNANTLNSHNFYFDSLIRLGCKRTGKTRLAPYKQ